MSNKFKLTPKRNLNDPDAPEKMYAIPAVTNRLTTHQVCKIVTNNTTLNAREAETTFNLVCDAIPRELQSGNSVQLGSLGWLRLSFSSEGVEDVTKFNAQSMIKNVRIIFTPSKELMNSVKNGLTFENVGVVEKGFTFPTTKSYVEYKTTGKLPVGGSTEPSGGTGGGSGETPLG